jgi:hypothetical protein
MQGSHRDKKSFPSPLAMKRDMKARRRIHGFWGFLPWTLAMSHYSEEDGKEKTKKKRYV